MIRYVLLAACLLGAANAASTTTMFPNLCPFFDLGLCFLEPSCYPALDFMGCEYCQCFEDPSLQELIVNIIVHLIDTNIANNHILMNQITLFSALIEKTLEAQYAASLASYYPFYKRALRDIRSAKESYLPAKPQA